MSESEILTLLMEVSTKDMITAKVVDPDTTWSSITPHVDWIAHEYPFKMALAFPDMTLQALEFASLHPQFKRSVERACALAIKEFITTLD